MDGMEAEDLVLGAAAGAASVTPAFGLATAFAYEELRSNGPARSLARSLVGGDPEGVGPGRPA